MDPCHWRHSDQREAKRAEGAFLEVQQHRAGVTVCVGTAEWHSRSLQPHRHQGRDRLRACPAPSASVTRGDPAPSLPAGRMLWAGPGRGV